jgi:uncharacterized protein YjbJ (UPF0337 family)
MNQDQIEGNWKQMVGVVRQKWGKLTDGDLAVIKGNREVLAGKLQKRYGIAVEEARRQIADFDKAYRAEPKSPEVAEEGDPVDSKTLKIGM